MEKFKNCATDRDNHLFPIAYRIKYLSIVLSKLPVLSQFFPQESLQSRRFHIISNRFGFKFITTSR